VISVESNTIVSGGNANRATAMQLTRKMSSPSKLSTVSNTRPAMQTAILVYCHAVQETGGETTVKLNIVDTTSDKKLMAITPREDEMVRWSGSFVSKARFVCQSIHRLLLECAA
jgi:hypothetical protein